MKIKNIHVHLTEEQIEARIKELGEEISAAYGDEPVCLICILKGSVFFTCELAKRITSPVAIEFMSVSSYGAEMSSSGVVRILHDLDASIEGRNVLLIEDIIDSGRTLSYLLENLKTRNPKSIKLCTLLDKPDRRVVDVPVDYVGFVIPDEFVVGYGLDYDQYYRNLPYIGFVEIEE
ncbi:MAG: hypoxanthine phosphoribosyltransferase [Clostridiales bacterium]|nr:hypoxanthine phosphoribosyltransferase [Clostridiales bacterium]